jgi:hypothetical protein
MENSNRCLKCDSNINENELFCQECEIEINIKEKEMNLEF